VSDLPAKKKRRSNNPALNGDAYNLEPGDNTKYTHLAVQVMTLPRVDLKNPEAVRQRVNDYIAITAAADVKPAVSGLALALGINRRTLWAIVHDQPTGGANVKPMNLPRESLDILKSVYDSMEYLLENYMLQGKINPVSGIFLAKNHYGYQDKTELSVSATTSEELDVATIRDRYLPGDSGTD